jgi:hypothetical protein
MALDGESAPAVSKNGGDSGVASRSTVPLFAALAFAVCCLRSFVLPHTPLLLWGDQLGYATKGARILGGELPYRDFFEFVTPGTELVFAGLFRILGVSLWLPNLLMALLAAMATAWVARASRDVVRAGFAWLPAMLMVGFVLYGSMDATHHWFSTLAVMGAISALWKGISTKTVALAGAMCGLAASFTQTKGAAVTVGFVAYLAWRSMREGWARSEMWRRCLLLCVAALSVFAVVNGPFVMAAGAGQWARDAIAFPVRYAGAVSANNLTGTWPEFARRAGFLKWIVFPAMYAGVPTAYLWFFFAGNRRGGEDQDASQDASRERLMLLAVAGVAMLAAILPGLSIRRISTVSPPALILLAWLLSERGRWMACLGKALGVVSLCIALAQIVAVQMRAHFAIDLPAGRVAILEPENYELYRWMGEHAHPGQWYFGLAPLILPLELRPAAPVDSVEPNAFTRPEQVSAVIGALENKRVPLIVLRREGSMPRPEGSAGDSSGPFFDYLSRHYRRIQAFSTGDEAWERIE